MTQKRPINALIIDDNQDYIDAMIPTFAENRIILKKANNLEDGIALLKETANIQFVILDGKCFVDIDKQEKNITQDNIPILAKDMIEKINESDDRYIQYCVNSAHSNVMEFMKGVFEGIFEKQNDTEKMIEFIHNRVSRTPEFKIRKKYKKAFKAYESYIDHEWEYLLLEAINNSELDKNSAPHFKTLRDIYESALLSLIHFGVIPEDFINDKGRPIITICMRFLKSGSRGLSFKDKTYNLKHNIPENIKTALNKLNADVNDLSHLSKNKDYKTTYMINFYCTLELLEWIPGFLDENFNN